MKPPRKTWLYFILNANDISITWDALAQMPVKHALLNPRFISQNPSGWKDIEIQAATNLKYFSLNRTFVTSLKFINEGANILRWYAYNDRGYDEDLYVLIYQWNRTNGTYETAYKGKLDFTGFSDNVETGVTMATKEGGILEYLNANDGVEYEIRCDNSNLAIRYANFQQGINLKDTFDYQFIPDIAPTYLAYSLPIVFITNEGDNIGIVKNSQTNVEDAGSFSYVETSSNYLLYSVFGITNCRIFGTITLLKNPDDPYPSSSIEFGLTAATSLHNNYNLVDYDLYNFNTPIPFDITINLAANEKLFIVGGSNALTPGFIQFDSTSFQIEFFSVNQPSKSYCLTWYDWYKQMVLKLSDGKYTGDSVTLANRTDLVVTCGDAIRNTDRTVVANYNIASSFADGFKSMSSDLDLALEIRNGVLWCEPKTLIYASNSPKIFDLGEISDVTIEAATDLLVNDIQAGYPDQQYDQRNGKYEFNAEQEWKLPVTLTAQQILDIRSTWRADAFGIEFIRATLTKLDTTDNAGDKQPFKLQVEKNGAIAPVSATIVKGAENNVFGNIKFDSISYNGGGENYFSANTFISEFTYINVMPETVSIGATIYASFSGSGTVTFTLNINGTPIATYSYSAATMFQRVDFNEIITLNQNDVVTININNGGATVNIQSAGIDFNVTSVPAFYVYNIYRDSYTSITGVLDNTVYNVNFSPHRQLLAHAAYLSGLLTQMQMDQLTLASSSKNVELRTVLAGITITEKAPIDVRDLGVPLFLPYYVRFKCKPQYTFLKTIVAINGGYIQATLNGNILYMLPFGEMSAKPAINEVQEWKLLLAPNNILSNLLKLSQQGLFLDYMGNLLFISDLNPVHFVKADYMPAPAYHYLDMYDEWVRKRNDRFDMRPNYIQRWHVGDNIELQFITANLGGIQIDVRDCKGNSYFSQSCTVIIDPAVSSPYTLQQCSIAGLQAGSYYILISYAGNLLAISEMQQFSTEEKAYRFDYSSSYNKLYGYFTQWKPCIRIDAMFMQWNPQSDFEDYEDDPGDIELINSNVNRSRNLILGTNDGIGGSGLPDFMMNKMNEILLLNQCYIEGQHYVRSTDSKLEPTQRSGNPFDFYTVEMQRAKNEKGLSFTGIEPVAQNGIIAYTLDGTGFGANDTILTIEVEDES